MLELMTLVVLSAPPKKTEPPNVPAFANAKAAVQTLKASYAKALSAGLEKGTAEGAAACATELPKLAKDASTKSLTLGRTSLQAASKKGGPRWVRDLIKFYEMREQQVGSADLADMSQSARTDDGVVHYAEPITLKQQCLICHGTNVEPTVAAALKKAYPNGVSSGFKLGAFRGVYWVESKP